MGFKQSTADPCAYVKEDYEGRTYLTVHVDDMLLASPSPAIRTWFENQVKQWFEISLQVNNLTYLGMSVIKSAEGIRVHQLGYIETLGIKFGVPEDVRSSCPTTSNLLESDEHDENMNVTKYLSLVMSLMYLARFTRPDILMPTTFLATKSAGPKVKDYNNLIDILSYVMNTRSKSLLAASSKLSRSSL